MQSTGRISISGRTATSPQSSLLTEEDLKELKKFRAIYFGAIGDPRIPPGILEKGILLALRFSFDQYVNLRPIKLLEGVETPLANKTSKDIDFVVVRENTEDFYVGIGSRFKKHQKIELEVVRDLYNVKFGLDVESDAEELAYQIGVVTREGARRVQTYAFELAEKRRKSSPRWIRQTSFPMCTGSGGTSFPRPQRSIPMSPPISILSMRSRCGL